MEKDRFFEYKLLFEKYISKDMDKYYFNLLKNIYYYIKLYNEYNVLDEELFNLRKDLGFKKRNYESLNNEFTMQENNLESTFSDFRYLSDNEIDYDFDLWLQNKEDIKTKRDCLDKEISLLRGKIEDLKKDENMLVESIDNINKDLNYYKILIKNKNNKYDVSNILLSDLIKVKDLMVTDKDKKLIEKYFVLNIRLKKLIFDYINNFNIDKKIDDKDMFDIKLFSLLYMGLDDSKEFDLDIMVNDPLFKDKVSLLNIMYDCFVNNKFDYNDLNQFEDIKFVNDKNMWFLDLIDLLKENNKNSNKIR